MEADMKCPKCNHVHNAHGAIRIDSDGEVHKIDKTKHPAPREGDLSVCFNCQALLRFGKDIKIERLWADDFLGLPKEIQKGMVKAIYAIKDYRKQKEGKSGSKEIVIDEKSAEMSSMSPYVRHFVEEIED